MHELFMNILFRQLCPGGDILALNIEWPIEVSPTPSFEAVLLKARSTSEAGFDRKKVRFFPPIFSFPQFYLDSLASVRDKR